MGPFFRRKGAADPCCLGGTSSICIFDFRKCPLRPPEGQNGPTWDLKNFPNWAGINFFWLDLNFSWLEFFFPAGLFFGLDLSFLTQLQILKMTQLTHFLRFFVHFLPLLAQLHTSTMTQMTIFGGFFAHFWPFFAHKWPNWPIICIFGPFFYPFEPLFGFLVADISYSRDKHWPSDMIWGILHCLNGDYCSRYVSAMATVFIPNCSLIDNGLYESILTCINFWEALIKYWTDCTSQ